MTAKSRSEPLLYSELELHELSGFLSQHLIEAYGVAVNNKDIRNQVQNFVKCKERDTITLDGKFTVQDLEAIIKFMKENAT